MSATDIDIDTLRDVAGTMIPASAEFGMPGADDPAIFEDIVKSIGRDLPHVREAVAEISARSGSAFGALDRDKREALINGFHAGGAPSIMTLGRVIASAYYRDDRVLLALKLEARAPYPKGHEVEQGDWSLLEVVRKRPPFWRDDRKV
ncbi:MAG: hypothetical protein ISP49_06580 [Reyranella sp.]|nr:hypothetical protein [Reyranella sp.]